MTKLVINHYDFITGMEIGLIFPKGEHHDVNKHIQIKSKCNNQTTNDKITSFSRASRKCVRVTDKSLDPRKGTLNIMIISHTNRLSRAVKKRETTFCSLHRNATISKISSQLLRHSVCNVILCSSCFSISYIKPNPQKLGKCVVKRRKRGAK